MVNEFYYPHLEITPDSKVYWANMGPIWDWQDPGGPHVGPMNLAIWALEWQLLLTATDIPNIPNHAISFIPTAFS